MIINDIIARKDLELVTNSQDVRAIDEYLGENYDGAHGYFVKVQDGDYIEVYRFDGTIPYINKDLETIKALS